MATWTNRDRITSMTDDELAKIIKCPIEGMPEYLGCHEKSCTECICKWLQSASEKTRVN